MQWYDSCVALDVETSGFGPDSHILEVAAVTFEKGEPVHAYSQLICPENLDWNSEKVASALAVNKLTKEDLRGKPTFAEILPDLMVELSTPVWVAHNMSFDFGQLQQEFARTGRTLAPPLLSVCTLALSAYLNPDAKVNKLAETAARYGVSQEGAHRAHVDATVCGNILMSMLARQELPTDALLMNEFCIKAQAKWKGKRR